jgi:hypothetical protein
MTSQTDRLVDLLERAPGASSLEITLAIGCVNVTGRVSDARKAGHNIEAVRDERGVFRYYLRPKVTTGEQLGWTA